MSELPLRTRKSCLPFYEQETLRLYAFDCLAVDGVCIMEKSLTSRYGVRLLPKSPFYNMSDLSLFGHNPEIATVGLQAICRYAQAHAWSRCRPSIRVSSMSYFVRASYVHRLTRALPLMSTISIKVKRMDLSYTVATVLNEIVPKLQHGHDGLIYTCATTRYVVGTDSTL